MKTCESCGARNFDYVPRCEQCGQPFDGVTAKLSERPETGFTIGAKLLLVFSTMMTSLFILIILVALILTVVYRVGGGHVFSSVLLLAFLICDLALKLFATLSFFKRRADIATVSIAFKVFTLLLVNPVAGLLMLCDEERYYTEIII